MKTTKHLQNLVQKVHYTVQFFLRIVGRTLHAIAVGFHMIKQGTIDVCVTTRNILYAFVNTFKCRAMMDVITISSKSF